MAWNYDDGRNVYKTSDGSTFTTEKEAQEYQDKKDGRTAESDRIAREYAEAMGKIIAQAWEMINNGDCKGAIAYLDDQTRSHGKDHFDGYDVPKGFLQPYAYAYKGLNDLRKAIELISEAILRYREMGNVEYILDRAYFYSLNKQWKLVQLDAETAMNMEPGGADFNDLGTAFYYRGLSFENTGEKDKAIIDYKTSADYNNEKSKDKLKSSNVYYNPKKPPATLQGKWINGIVLAVVFIIAAFNGLMYIPYLGLIIILPLAVFDIFYIKLWRKTRLKVYPLKKKIMLFSVLAGIVICFSIYGITVSSTLNTLAAREAEVGLFAEQLVTGQSVTVTENEGQIYDDGYTGKYGTPITDKPMHQSYSGVSVIKYVTEGDILIVKGKAENVITGSYNRWFVPIEHQGTNGFIEAKYINPKSDKEKAEREKFAQQFIGTWTDDEGNRWDFRNDGSVSIGALGSRPYSITGEKIIITFPDGTPVTMDTEISSNGRSATLRYNTASGHVTHRLKKR